MRRLFCLLFALLLSVAGCSHMPVMHAGYMVHSTPDPRSFRQDIQPVYIDKAFSPKMLTEIQGAVAEWNFALNGYRQYRITSNSFELDMPTVVQIVTTGQGLVVLAHTEAQMPEDDNGRTLAWVPRLGAPVIHVAVDRIGSRDLKLIVMHEIAHTLYVAHTDVSGSLMSRFYEDQVDCIDEYTARAVSNLHEQIHWDWRHMNFCPQVQ